MGPVLLPSLTPPHWLLLLTKCFKKCSKVEVVGLQGTWSIEQLSLKSRQWEHEPNPRAHQNDRSFLEYWLQVHKDASDTRELLQEPHPPRNEDGLVKEGVLDLSTGNTPALEGTKPGNRSVTPSGHHRGSQKMAQDLLKGGWIVWLPGNIPPCWR